MPNILVLDIPNMHSDYEPAQGLVRTLCGSSLRFLFCFCTNNSHNFFWLLLRVEEKHNAEIESLEKEWPRYTNNSHHGLSQLPKYTMASASPSLWNSERETETFEEAHESAQLEGETFSRNYLEDVQFILSRTNHHHHKMTKHGRVPLTACKPKGKKEESDLQGRSSQR